MSKKRRSQPAINVRIHGDVSGQAAVGENISQTQSVVHNVVTPAELQELRQLLADLRSKVEVEVPAENKEAALQQVDELEQAVTEQKPNPSRMQSVKEWFAKHLPGLVGAVTSVVVHPIVGKLVEAAGEAVAADFKKRFG